MEKSGRMRSREGKEETVVGENKGKRLWKKVKYELVEYHALPDYMKDNEFILRHYRAEWPLKEALMSVFSIHNETLNVWTHLIGFLLFLSLTIYSTTGSAAGVPNVVPHPTLKHFPDVLGKADLHKLQKDLLNCLPSLPHMPDLHKFHRDIKSTLPGTDSLPPLPNWHIVKLLTNCLPEWFSHRNHTNVCVLSSMKEDVVNIITPLMTRQLTRWPFFAFLGGSMFCLLASSACHLFCCHSKRLSYFLLRLDYAGIAAIITTSYYPPVYYTFICQPFYSNFYLGCSTIMGFGTVLVSLLPVFEKPQYRVIRTVMFLGLAFSGAFPIAHKLILFGNQPEALRTTGGEILMFTLYGIGALIYATRIPERWMPGMFDIVGHGHQLFHILVVAGAYTHYLNGLVYLKWRELEGC